MVLNNRIIREFLSNKVKYLGLIILVIISSMTIVGFIDSTDSILNTAEIYFKDNNCEDGSFVLKNKINNITLNKLNKLGIDVEEKFYSDCKINDTQTIRVYKKRKNINKISIVKGNDLKNTNDILLDDKRESIAEDKIGNYISIDGRRYYITGYAVVPDYTFVKKQSSDISNDPKQFGIAFVNEEDFNKFDKKIYEYSFKTNGVQIDEVKSILQRNTELNSFSKSEDNSKVTGYYDDLKINKYVGALIGSILCGMIGFIISMMVVSIIDKESPIIGALYSLGYVKREILNHFMCLPTIVVTVGAVIGTILGFILQGPLGEASAGTYSFPEIEVSFEPYIIFLGILLPMLIVITVNYFILSKRLSRTPLQLLRKEKKDSKFRAIRIRGFNFITRFRITQVVREIGGNVMLFVGVLFAMLLLMMGLGMNSSMNVYIDNIKHEPVPDYTYLLKFPIHVQENDSIEKAYIKGMTMYCGIMGCNMNVTLQGIREDTCFYDFEISDDDNCVYISNTIAEKFGVYIGDFIDINDTENNRVYKLKVGGIVNYSVGLYMFMNIKQMNRLMDNDISNYNAFLSRNELDINNDYVYSVITLKDIIAGAENTMDIMRPMQIIAITVAATLFILIMYLLLKLMIDKSIAGISLIKVFGFNQKEVSKLYIGSSLYVIIICLILGTPFTLHLYKAMWPSLISNVEGYIAVDIRPQYYLYMGMITLASYWISTLLLKNHINEISLSEALKNRD